MMYNVVIEVFLGLALFIYGITLMNRSLKNLSLSRIKALMGKFTTNRFTSFLTGFGVTSIIQSSSATSVLVIGLINVGVLNLMRAVPIIFGANIGTTMTAQLIAFKLTKIAPWFIISGVGIFLTAKSLKWKNIALSIFGFGLLFYGLSIMSGAVKPLKGSPFFEDLFINFGAHPLLGIFVGLIATVIMQSSSTVIGIMIALATAGLLNFQAAFYLLLGDNIGTCITAVLASIGGTNSSKRLALGHSLFNIIGAAIALLMAPLYFKFIPMLSGDVARQIANAHTTFNILNALIFLPLTPLFVKFLLKVMPKEDYLRKETQFLDKNLLQTPALAINAAVTEMVVMAQVCGDMLKKLKGGLKKFEYKRFEEIETDESSIDELQMNITDYLAEITRQEMSRKEVSLVPNLLHSVNDLERVGDHAENLANIYRRKHEEKIAFSSEAVSEIDALTDNIDRMIELTVQAMEKDDHQAAEKSALVEAKTNELTKNARHNHMERLSSGKASAKKALIFNDILIQIERIGDHLYNITQGIVHHGKR